MGHVLGNDHILNIPNSYIGLAFFPVLMILCESLLQFVIIMYCSTGGIIFAICNDFVCGHGVGRCCGELVYKDGG